MVDQKIGQPGFVLAYLRRRGHYNWLVSVLYAVACWVVLVVFYERDMHLLFYHSLRESWLEPLLPDAIPQWLIF